MSRIADRARSADDIETELVPVPQWGDDLSILVKGMDGNNRAEFLRRFQEAREADDERSLAEVEMDLVILCSFDPTDDTKVFGAEDSDWLFSKSGAVIGRLSKAAMTTSGLTEASEKAVGKGGSSKATTSTSSSS